MINNAVWIGASKDVGNAFSTFSKRFHLPTKVSTATLYIAANGTYKTVLNGKCIDGRIPTSGTVDITDMLAFDNTLEITVTHVSAKLMAVLRIEYINGATETICSAKDWHVKESYHTASKTSEIYNVIELDGNTNYQ